MGADLAAERLRHLASFCRGRPVSLAGAASLYRPARLWPASDGFVRCVVDKSISFDILKYDDMKVLMIRLSEKPKGLAVELRVRRSRDSAAAWCPRAARVDVRARVLRDGGAL